jgi:hypothetical protein
MFKSTLVFVASAAAIFMLAFALNPSPERHREKIKEVTGQRSPIAGALGVGSLKAFASTYHSLGVASYTTAGNKTLSVGAFGVVVVPD